MFNGRVSIHLLNADRTIKAYLGSTVVVHGALSVDLQDSDSPSHYALYRADYAGRDVHASEIWSVPQTDLSYPHRSVVIASPDGAGKNWRSTRTAESDVTNLQSDLSIRPIAGPGFTSLSVATINGDGQIEGVAGDPGECVLVDGTSGPCGLTPAFVDGEVPTGVIDGANSTFTLSNTPDGASLSLSVNGLNQTASSDYSLNGPTITFATGATPQPSDSLLASYRVSAGSSRTLRSGGSKITQYSLLAICDGTGSVPQAAPGISTAACSFPSAVLHKTDQLTILFGLTEDSTGGADLVLTVNDRTVWSGALDHGKVSGSAVVSANAVLDHSSAILHVALHAGPHTANPIAISSLVVAK
jgi:hypothetical protein